MFPITPAPGTLGVLVVVVVAAGVKLLFTVVTVLLLPGGQLAITIGVSVVVVLG